MVLNWALGLVHWILLVTWYQYHQIKGVGIYSGGSGTSSSRPYLYHLTTIFVPWGVFRWPLTPLFIYSGSTVTLFVVAFFVSQTEFCRSQILTRNCVTCLVWYGLLLIHACVGDSSRQLLKSFRGIQSSLIVTVCAFERYVVGTVCMFIVSTYCIGNAPFLTEYYAILAS